MNEQRSSLQPAPQPMCAALAPLLPLLSLDKLDPEEAVSVREHVATCDFCRGELREFDALRDALRRDYAPAHSAESKPSEPVPMLTLATILSAANDDDTGDDDERDGHVASPPWLATHPGASPAHGPHRRRGGRTGYGALAAALLLALLAGVLFRGRTGQPARIVVSVPGLGTLTEFPLPTAGSDLSALVAGRDGNMWFAEAPSNSCSSGRIGRITPQGVVTEFDLPLPQGVVLGCVIHGVSGLASAPDGAIWFTVYSDLANTAGKIGRLSPRDGKVTWFALPAGYSADAPIVAGPDGNLWFVTGDFGTTPGGRAAIGQITPKGDKGDIAEFPLPDSHPPPSFLAAGPDGSVWFVTGDERVLHHYVVGRMSSAGVVTTDFPVPTTDVPMNSITMIATGPDGNLWFTASGPKLSDPAGQIGRITPQGTITRFQVLSNDVQLPVELAAGPDGNLWFVASGMNTLDRITLQGTITEFALAPGITISGGGMTLGPDGNLWFSALHPQGNVWNTPAASDTIDRLELQRSG